MLNIFPNDTDCNTSLLSLVMCFFISDLSVKNMFEQCACLCSISVITVFDGLSAYMSSIVAKSSEFALIFHISVSPFYRKVARFPLSAMLD